MWRAPHPPGDMNICTKWYGNPSNCSLTLKRVKVTKVISIHQLGTIHLGNPSYNCKDSSLFLHYRVVELNTMCGDRLRVPETLGADDTSCSCCCCWTWALGNEKEKKQRFHWFQKLILFSLSLCVWLSLPRLSLSFVLSQETACIAKMSSAWEALHPGIKLLLCDGEKEEQFAVSKPHISSQKALKMCKTHREINFPLNQKSFS